MSTGSPRFDTLRGPTAESALIDAATGCFQQAAWIRAVAAARGRPHGCVVVVARWIDGRQALLPGAVHRRLGMPVFEAMPMGAYGGWIGSPTLEVDEERDLCRAWLAQARWPLVVLTSLPGRERTLPEPAWHGGPKIFSDRLAPRRFTTHVLDLESDDAALLRRMQSRLRGYLRRFDERGYEFRLAHDAQALAQMFRWYVRGSRAWREASVKLLPQTFFGALADAGKAEVWTAVLQGREVGAALFLVGADSAQYQASGTLRIDAPVSPMEALLWAAARRYRDRGLKTLNLGASDGLDSVARFKTKFGAREVTYLRVAYPFPAWLRAGDSVAS